MAAPSFDAIVVGSGITGGWAAKELCERGLKTLVLEAGRPIDPAHDYVEHVPPWQMKFRGFGDRAALERDQFIQRHCYACNEYSGKFFVNDRENPYTFDADKPFHWIRGRQVGGKSIMWGRQAYRWSDLDFEANARDGFGVDWPIRYADIAPWYDYVEEFIGISGERLGLPQLPDGQFLPPMALNCAEQVVRDGVAKHFAGERVVTIGRVAILTQAHGGRAACHYCGPCERGCITRSYFSSIGVTLPAARLPVRLDARVGPHPLELEDPPVPDRPRELERRARPEPDGPHDGRGSGRHSARPGRPHRARESPQRSLRPPVPERPEQAPGLPARLRLSGGCGPRGVAARWLTAGLRPDVQGGAANPWAVALLSLR